MTQKRAFVFEVIEEDKSPFQQRTYEVWNTTGQTYQIPNSRIEPTCQPLEEGATGIIQHDPDGNWYWVRTTKSFR